MPRRKTSSASTSRSIAVASSASGTDASAAIVRWSKARPITAAVCATSFTDFSRSRRAISELCSDVGMASRVLGVAPGPPASSTALVISSTNSGTPSVRAAISSISRVRQASCRAGDARDDRWLAARPSLLSASRVTTGWPPKPRPNVGRAVISSSTRAGLHPIERQLDQLQGRGIDPVRVFDQPNSAGCPRGEADKLIEQGRERAGAALLRTELERCRSARCGVEAEQRLPAAAPPPR